MRPNSIIMFERLFLASLALSAIGTALAYDTMVAELDRNPAMQQLGFGHGFMIGILAVGFAVYLLLWFLIARRASTVAKWLLVVFVILGLVSFVASLSAALTLDTTMVLALVTYALEVAAVWFLFRPDASAWFKGDGKADPATFD